MLQIRQDEEENAVFQFLCLARCDFDQVWISENDSEKFLCSSLGLQAKVFYRNGAIIGIQIQPKDSGEKMWFPLK